MTSKRARRPTEKIIALQEQKANHTQAHTQKKSSKKKQAATANNSDLSSEEEHPPKKRRRQPDPAEIVEVDEESEGVVIDEESGGEENEDEVEANLVDDDDEDGLQEQHHADIPAHTKVKKDSTKDLCVVFSNRVSVTFKKKGGEMETVTGRWCGICRLVHSIHKIT